MNIEQIEIIADKVIERMQKNYKETLHNITDITSDYIVFNYPTYFGNGDFDKQINRETVFLSKQVEYIRAKGFKGFIHINGYVTKKVA